MSHIKQFEDALSSNLVAEHEARTKNIESVGFLEIILPILVPILINIMNGCLSSSTTNSVSDGLVRMGPIQRWRLKKSIKEDEDIAKEDRKTCFNATVKTIQGMDHEEVNMLVEEFNSEPGIGLW